MDTNAGRQTVISSVQGAKSRKSIRKAEVQNQKVRQKKKNWERNGQTRGILFYKMLESCSMRQDNLALIHTGEHWIYTHRREGITRHR